MIDVVPTIPEDGAPGFFARNRLRRLVIGIVITTALAAAYLFGIQSYRAGLDQAFPEQQPPTGGVSVLIVPDTVTPASQELPVSVLLFPSSSLVDAEGLLTREIEIRIQPALSGSTLIFPAGDAPSPQSVMLPASGMVQQYPLDRYTVAAQVRAHSIYADVTEALPVQAAMYFRVPGWSGQDAVAGASTSGAAAVSMQLVRDGSTKSIAFLLLLLMVVLALIAILVTGSSTRGRMKLDLSVAAWMTALLFALIPLRGFFPGAPPLGSWMDILVFFWVELILMLAVAAVAGTILMRARDAAHHPQELP
ncbi:MAG: DUF4436 family protein [Candidatus Nanopelagicales bacterium]|nr:DUF4436 family protein [Candidatus Nanopelagicales bacterium]